MIPIKKSYEGTDVPSIAVDTNQEDLVPRKKILAEGGEPIEPVIVSGSFTENGTYNAPEGADGYNPIVVDVPAPIERIVCDYDFTSGSIEDLNRNNVKLVQTHTPQTITSGSGLLFDHNFSGIYPNYTFLPMKDYIVEISIGNWTIQSPTSSFNNRFVGLDYKTYFGVSGTTGMSLGYVPILKYDRTLETPVWTVIDEVSEDYFANKTFYIKLQNYYNTTSRKFEIKILYSEDGETWIDTNNDFTNLNTFFTLNIGSDVTRTNTDASTIKDFYLKKLKITEYDTNIVIPE